MAVIFPDTIAVGQIAVGFAVALGQSVTALDTTVYTKQLTFWDTALLVDRLPSEIMPHDAVVIQIPIALRSMTEIEIELIDDTLAATDVVVASGRLVDDDAARRLLDI